LRRAAALLLALPLLARAEAPDPQAPVRIATGAFSVPVAARPGALRLEVMGGPVTQAAARLELLLPETAPTLGGARPSPRELAAATAQAAGDEGAFLVWLGPPMRGVAALAEGLRRREAVLELDVEFREGEAEAPAEAQRLYSLWALARPEGVVVGTVRRRDAAGQLLAARRYAGPLAGWPDPARGWVDPARDEVKSAPAQDFPAAWLSRWREREEARAKLVPAPEETPVDFQVVAHGEHALHVRKPLRKVLRTPGELSREWDRLHDGVVPRLPTPRYTPAEEIFLVVYLGRVPGPGYGVEVSAVHERPDGTLVVGTRTRLPPRGAELPAAPASPYVMVRVARRAGTRVEFRPGL